MQHKILSFLTLDNDRHSNEEREKPSSRLKFVHHSLPVPWLLHVSLNIAVEKNKKIESKQNGKAIKKGNFSFSSVA